MRIIHRIILTLLIVGGLCTTVYLAATGYEYYTLDLADRPYAELHETLRPTGVKGHGFGVIGSAMLLLLFLYSVRKRVSWFPKIGKLRTWLNYHIFLGIMGPVLVTFHTTFKFGGIVSVSYWSMITVMVSGFIGRYLYSKIPRRISGQEMNLKEVRGRHEELGMRLKEEYQLPDQILTLIEDLGKFPKKGKQGLKTLWYMFISDISRPLEFHRLNKKIKQVIDVDDPRLFKDIKHIVKERVAITRKIVALETTHRFFHNWHVFHKPFAYIMIIIMFVHITVVVLFGYHWIF